MEATACAMEGTVREAIREERALVGGGKGGDTLAKVEPVFKWVVLEGVAALAGLADRGLTGLVAGFSATLLALALGVNLGLTLTTGLPTALALEAVVFFAVGLVMVFLIGLAVFFAGALAVGLATFTAGLAADFTGLTDLDLVTGAGAFFSGLLPLAPTPAAPGLAAGFLVLAIGLLALAGALVFFNAAFTCCLPAKITSSCANLTS